MSASATRRGVNFSSINVENGLHQSAALSAMTLLVTAHRAIMNTGFTLRREGFSTDIMVVFVIGTIATVWTTLVIVSGVFLGQEPCRNGFAPCLARLSYAPWLIQLLFVFWVIALWLQILYIRVKERFYLRQSPHGSDIERSESRKAPTLWERLIMDERFRIWKMKCSRGPLDWSASINWKFRAALYVFMSSVVCITAFGAMRTQLYTVGLLNIVGLVLFIVGAGGSNKYATAPHMYAQDMLRVVLETRHQEGTVYILPYRKRGIDAVWSPKIDYEHREVDEGSVLAAHVHEARERKRGQLKSLDHRLAAFNTATQMAPAHVSDLATWLYTPEAAPAAMRTIACVRAPGIHLISKNLMITLWHAEYVIFMQRHLIDEDLQKLVGTLRTSKKSGMDGDGNILQIGSKPGLEGYQEAVKYIYTLFDEPLDAAAILPTYAPPQVSDVLATCPNTIEGYVAELWDHCISTQESTFAAMYAFCFFQDCDIGTDAAHGLHGFPLRARDRDGDLVSWHVIWRQAWYGVVIAQLTSMSPIILSAFVAGILQ